MPFVVLEFTCICFESGCTVPNIFVSFFQHFFAVSVLMMRVDFCMCVCHGMPRSARDSKMGTSYMIGFLFTLSLHFITLVLTFHPASMAFSQFSVIFVFYPLFQFLCGWRPMQVQACLSPTACHAPLRPQTRRASTGCRRRRRRR